MDDAVCLTIDVDWAPEEVIAEAVAALDARGARATFFATHDSPLLRTLAEGGPHEVGVHPNFEGAADGGLPELMRLFPQAVTGRSHRLHVSSEVLNVYRAHGLRFESNVFLPGHPHLRPVARFADLISVPFYWSDDKHLDLDRPFELAAVGLDEPGLKVLNFHPVHVFLNSETPAHYERAKPVYHDPSALRAARGAHGIADLFAAVLDHVGPRARTIAEVARAG